MGTVHPHSVERFAQGTFARLRPLPTRSTSTTEPQRGDFQDHEEPTAILRPSEDARLFLTYSRHLPSTRGPPLSPERHSRLYTHPLRGNRQGPLSEFLASFLLFVTTI